MHCTNNYFIGFGGHASVPSMGAVVSPPPPPPPEGKQAPPLSTCFCDRYLITAYPALSKCNYVLLQPLNIFVLRLEESNLREYFHSSATQRVVTPIN